VRIESARLKLQSGVTGKIIIVNRGGAKGECGTPSMQSSGSRQNIESQSARNEFG
jgi:hypothetical protein